MVQFTVSNGAARFVANKGGTYSAIDSDVITTGTAVGGATVGWTHIFKLEAQEDKTDIDAGVKFARIGDRVWQDSNGNGIQDPIETGGVSGVAVKLYSSAAGLTAEAVNAFGITVSAVTTTALGIYQFSDLKADTYVVEFITQGGYIITQQKTTTSGIDSDADRITGLTGDITLAAGEQDITIDCGMHTGASVGNYVFNDRNFNDTQDKGIDVGVSGVAVTLYVSKGGVTSQALYWDKTTVESITTTGSGFYKFTGLDPGDYMVQFKTTDSAFRATYPNKGSDDTKDSDGIKTTTNYSVVLTEIFTLTSGVTNLDIDQGFFEMNAGITIDKTVYEGDYDALKIGSDFIATLSSKAITYIFKIKNTGNTILKDITVIDADLGISLANMTTVSGTTILTPGATLVAYYVTTLAVSLVNTAKTTGTAVYDMGGEPINGMAKPTASDTATVIIVNPGLKVYKTVYSGHTSGSGIGSKLLADTSGNAITYVFKIINTSDTFLTDIILTDNAIKKGGSFLTNGGMTLKSGSMPLTPGSILEYYFETTLTGDLFNTVSAIGTPCSPSGTIFPLVPKPTSADYAEVQVGSSIGDSVWYDTNGDGIKDTSEPGVSGVTVELYNAGGLVSSTATNINGYYTFDKLTKGDYRVKVITGSSLDGYKQSADRDTTLDNQTNVSITKSATVIDNADFGYEPIPHLKFTKTVNPPNAKPGQTVIYTLTVTNDGKAELEDIWISDTAVGINITIAKLTTTGIFTTDVAFNLPSTFVGPWINIAEAWSSTTAIVTAQAITNVSPPSSPPPPVIPPVIPPVVPPIGPGGGTVDTEEDTPIGGTVPGTGGTVVTPPGDGTVTVEDGKWTYTPDPGFVGTDSFVIVTIDDDGVPISYEIIVNVLEKDNLHLPKTGGVDQGFLYGTGFLLMLLGLMLLRRRSYNESRGRRKRA